MNWLKSLLLEKWIGRVIVLALAAVSGWLSQYIPADVVANWVTATQALIEAALPILLAWILGAVRHKIALAKMPE